MKGAAKKIFDYESTDDDILDILHTRIACGFYHCLAIGPENKMLWGWGKNQYGVLGSYYHSEDENLIIQPEIIRLCRKEDDYFPLQVSCGKHHSAVLASKEKKFKAGSEIPIDGEVFMFGDSSHGKLGVKDENITVYGDLLKPINAKDYTSRLVVSNVVVFPSSNKRIKMVSCGSTFTLALDIAGEVYSWGEGATGALGNGLYQDELIPYKITFPGHTKIKFINAGYFHSAAITENFKLFTWGIGSEGQLGHKSNLNINSPKKVEFFDDDSIAFISCGMFHTGCIDFKGFFYTWGGNKNGQLGHGDYEDRNYPFMVKYFKNYSVCYANCGSTTTFVVTEEGRTFSFGSNLNSKLAGTEILDNEVLQSNTFPTPIESQISIQYIHELNRTDNEFDGCRIYQIATSNQFCLALTNRGKLFTWGNNNNGCLGRGAGESDLYQLNSSNREIKALEEDTHLISFDPLPHCIYTADFRSARKEKTPEATYSQYFIDVKAGLYHSVGLTNAGEVYVWGSNQFSQHGLVASKLRDHYNKIADYIKMNQELEFFSSIMFPSLVETFDIKENKRVTQISCGYEYVFAVQNNKIVYSWGRNTHGQCGIGSVSNFVEEPHLITFFDSNVMKEIACGENHTLVLDDKGDLYSCGCSYGGKLGLGFMTTVQTSFKQIALKGVGSVACGPNHSMALVRDKNNKNALYSWGSGWNGELGHGNRDNVYNPKYVETKYSFASISCGTHHSAGITTEEQKLAVWGPYSYLGIYRTEDPNDKGFYPAPTIHPAFCQNEKVKFTQVLLGDHYNLAVASNKDIYYWGTFDIFYKNIIKLARAQNNNEEGAYESNMQTPIKLQNEIKFEALSVSSNHCLGIAKPHNKLYSWGIDGNTGRLGLGYEFNDEEMEEEMKKAQNMKKYVSITKYDEPVSLPILIHFLHFLLIKLGNDIKKKIALEKGPDPKIFHKGSSGSNQKLNSKGNIQSQQNLNVTGYPDAGRKLNDSKRLQSGMGGSKTYNEKSSKLSSSGIETETITNKNKYELFERCQASDGDQEENYLNYRKTQKYFNINIALYQDIKKQIHSTVITNLTQKKKLKKRITGIILKRISSYPFEAKFINKEEKKIKLNNHPQFYKNHKKFQAIFTLLQLHPCYLLNIYKADKLGPDQYFELVVETFGDMENDHRKIALYMNLCQLILKYDLDKLIENLDEEKEFELDISLNESSKFFVFVKLFIHLFNSSIHNRKWTKFCLKKILDNIDTEIYETEKGKNFKQTALVYQDILEIKGDMDKKSVYSVKVALLVKILKVAIKECTDSVKTVDLEKQIKRLAAKVKDIFVKKLEKVHFFTEEQIQQIDKKILNLIFTPLYLEFERLEKIGNQKYTDDQTNKKERILVKNYNAFNTALQSFIQGKELGSKDQKETWLEEINNYICKNEATATRKNMYTTIAINPDDKKNNEELQQSLLLHILKHSFSGKQEIITVSLKTLVVISHLINTSLNEFKVMNPIEKEILYRINQKLLEEKENFHNYNMTMEDEKIKFNIKLKTKQLTKLENDKKIKQCRICKCYMIEDFLKTEDAGLVEEFPILNPESLESTLISIISIKDFEKHRYDALFSNKTDIEKNLEEFIKRYKSKIKYEEEQLIRTFLKQFQEAVTLKKQAKEGLEKMINLAKPNPNDNPNFQVIKEIKKNLEEKALRADIYIKKNQILEGTLTKLKEKVNSGELINNKFYERALKNCFYGLANREFEKPLQNNPIALSGKMGASIRATSMSNDLYENMQYLLDEKQKNFSLFGCYSYQLLKSKRILESLNEDVLYRIELPKLKQKLASADLSTIQKLKNNFYYVFSDNRQQGLQIHLCFRQMHFKFYRWLCGFNKKQKKNFEIIIETFEIKEDDLLKIRKSERELENMKSEKFNLNIGKYSKFNLTKFLELINSLQNHYMIYDDIFVKGDKL